MICFESSSRVFFCRTFKLCRPQMPVNPSWGRDALNLLASWLHMIYVQTAGVSNAVDVYFQSGTFRKITLEIGNSFIGC
jgi:hypothetical protein